MKYSKARSCLLFPPVAVLVLLIPISAAVLVYAMMFLDESDLLRIGAYILSFYTLVILCARVPQMIRFFKELKRTNRYARLWTEDVRLRMKVTLAGCVVWNGGYAVMQLGLGIYNSSAWFYSLAVYYFLLATMRLFLACHIFKYRPGEEMHRELKYYRACGRVFLIMNLTLSCMLLYIVRGDHIVHHGEITAIAIATYTFTSLTMATINVIRYRRFNSPVFSASKAISLASACVSIMTLENIMLTTFSDKEMTAQAQRMLKSLTGGAISLFIVAMAVYMIVKANREIKCLEDKNEE